MKELYILKAIAIFIGNSAEKSPLMNAVNYLDHKFVVSRTQNNFNPGIIKRSITFQVTAEDKIIIKPEFKRLIAANPDSTETPIALTAFSLPCCGRWVEL